MVLFINVLISMTEDERQLIEQEIINNFENEKKELDSLKNKIQVETDVKKKEEMEKKTQDISEELNNIKNDIDRLRELQEKELKTLKDKLEEMKIVRLQIGDEAGSLKASIEQQNMVHEVPTTYEMLKDSKTSSALLEIIRNNSTEFKNVPWDTPEAKLECIFKGVRENIVQLLNNKFWHLKIGTEVINKTMAPAIEWSLMQMLRKQWNEANGNMLKWLNQISVDKLWKFFRGVKGFAESTDTGGMFQKFDAWINALDFLSVNNSALQNPKRSEVLTNPIKFQKYLDDMRFSSPNFSPYSSLSIEDYNQLLWIKETDLNYWITDEEKNILLNHEIEWIWNIKVAPNSRTTSLIVNLLDKSKAFLKNTQWLQNSANNLLDWVNSFNKISKIFWVDLIWEVSKTPEKRWLLFKILDFICKLIGITWWLEWIVKNWRMDRLELSPDKNANISTILVEYKNLMKEENKTVSITDKNSCHSVLNEFVLHDMKEQSESRWDKLRDSIIDKIDINLISPKVVQQCLWNDYIKTEIVNKDWKQKRQAVVDVSKIDESKKQYLVQKHMSNMLQHLSNYDSLEDFYSTISTIDDLSLSIVASFYADKNDVIEWVKARVLLPSNYWVMSGDSADISDSAKITNPTNGRNRLDSQEFWEKSHVTEQYIYDKAVQYWITDKRQVAYVLSTVSWECWFKNIKEIGWENRDYGKVDTETWKAYYGRWFLQLTHKDNYAKYTEIIRSSWLDFKDNDWVTIQWSTIDLVKNPDVILSSNDLAVFVLVDRMKNWGPSRQENKKLDYYFNDNKSDYYGARAIINGMSSSPEKYASTARNYYEKLSA